MGCGTGTQTRISAVTSGTAACPALSEDRACNPQSCPTPAQGVVTITNVNSGKVLNVQGNSWDNGGNVQQWDNPHETSSHWRIQAVGDGVSTITNVNSGKVLNVQGNFWGNGGNVQQWDNPHETSSQWRIQAVGDGVSTIITNVNSAGVASADNADATDLWGGGAGVASADNADAAGIWAGSANPQS